MHEGDPVHMRPEGGKVLGLEVARTTLLSPAPDDIGMVEVVALDPDPCVKDFVDALHPDVSCSVD